MCPVRTSGVAPQRFKCCSYGAALMYKSRLSRKCLTVQQCNIPKTALYASQDKLLHENNADTELPPIGLQACLLVQKSAVLFSESRGTATPPKASMQMCHSLRHGQKK